MHDHALQFKVDLDINGTANTLVKHEFVPAEVKYKWSNVTKHTMKLDRSEVTNEDQGKMVRSPLYPSHNIASILGACIVLAHTRGGVARM